MANHLYNGVELPALPDWDKETYPYAYIEKAIPENLYCLRVRDANITVESDGLSYTRYKGTSCLLGGILEDGSWNLSDTVYTSTEDASYKINRDDSCYILVWTNTDILNSDGTLYLAASEPVPVAVTTYDPASLLMGWMAGRRIAGQRRKGVEG